MGKCWDTKQVNDFIEVFEHAAHSYMEGLGYIRLGYERYKTNETFVGGGAEKTKEFIGTKQSEFNRLQYELSKEMVKRYVDLDDTFKTMVDPAADAKIDTDVVGHIRTHFQRQYEEYETLAFAIQQRTMEDVDKFKKYCGDIEEVYVRDALAQYEEFCGTGGFLYNCIKKVEEFDDEACNQLYKSGLKNNINEDIAEMSNTASQLDSINPKVVDIEKQFVSLMPLSTSASGVAAYNPTLLATNGQVATLTQIDPATMAEIESIAREFLIAKDYAMSEINQILLELPRILSEADGLYPIGDLIALGLIAIDAIMITILITKYLAEKHIHFSKPKGKSKGKGKSKDKNKGKSNKEKPHRKNKDGEPLGKNGPEFESDTKWQRGKTERVDVENPNPGKGGGNVHYHDAQDEKYIFDPVDGKLYLDEEPYPEAPPSIQKVLKDPVIQKAIDKALKYLGEPPFYK